MHLPPLYVKSHDRLTRPQILPISDCKPSPALQMLQNKIRCNLRVGHLMATRLASLRDVSTHDLPLPRAKWSTSNRFISSRIEFSSRNPTFSNDMDSHGPHHCLPLGTWQLVAFPVPRSTCCCSQTFVFAKEKSPKRTRLRD